MAASRLSRVVAQRNLGSKGKGFSTFGFFEASSQVFSNSRFACAPFHMLDSIDALQGLKGDEPVNVGPLATALRALPHIQVRAENT